MNDRDPEPKICASCGEPFGCGAKLDGCWCTEIELTKQAADLIRNNFKYCLCRKCLAKYSADEQIIS